MYTCFFLSLCIHKIWLLIHHCQNFQDGILFESLIYMLFEDIFGARLFPYSWHHISTTQPVRKKFSSIRTWFYFSFLCVSCLEEVQSSLYIKSMPPSKPILNLYTCVKLIIKPSFRCTASWMAILYCYKNKQTIAIYNKLSCC